MATLTWMKRFLASRLKIFAGMHLFTVAPFKVFLLRGKTYLKLSAQQNYAIKFEILMTLHFGYISLIRASERKTSTFRVVL